MTPAIGRLRESGLTKVEGTPLLLSAIGGESLSASWSDLGHFTGPGVGEGPFETVRGA